MPDKFDPYREALVMETLTIWSEDYEDMSPADKARIAETLHAAPQDAAKLEYIRTHTGFCRKITVSTEDVERVSSLS